VGDQPLRTVTSTPRGVGIVSVSSTGRIPAVAAHVPVTVISGGKQTTTSEQVYGEIDEDHLDDRLHRPGLGDTYLVDGDRRVLAASVGFTAYQQLPDPGLTALAIRTLAGDAAHRRATSGVVGGERRGVSSHAAVAAAVPLAASGPTEALDWQIVSADPAQSLPLAPYETQWHTMLAGLLGLTVSIACLGWLHVVVVRPARSLAALAVRLAEGDRRTIFYPVHHDEVGSVTRGFELLRQTLARDGRRPGDRPEPGRTPPVTPGGRPATGTGGPQGADGFTRSNGPGGLVGPGGHTGPARVTWGTSAQPEGPAPSGNVHQPAPWA
jgi:hypothetical protein